MPNIISKLNWFQKALIFHLLFAIVKIIIVYADGLSLFTEEAQYWLWSQHIDWSYATKPPMVAWMNFISTGILGDVEIAIKLNAIVLGLLTGLMIFKLAKLVTGSSQTAFLSSVLLYLFPFFIIPSFYFTTDAPLMFFWVLTTYAFMKAMQSDTWQWWILTGVFAGLGFLSKYTMVIFMPASMLYLLVEKKKPFTNRKYWVSVMVAALFTVPVVIWNYQREFESFLHVAKLGGVSAKKSAFTFKYLGEYLGGQVLALGLLAAPFLIAGILRSFRSVKHSSFSFFTISAAITFLLFLVISINKRVEINWSFFAYTPLAIILAQQVIEFRRKKLIWSAIVVSALLFGIYFFPAAPEKLFNTSLIPIRADSHKRMAGWEEMGSYLDRKIESLGTEKYFVFSESYHIASEMAFYSKKSGQTYCIDIGRRSNQFDYWPGIEQFVNRGYHGIFVSTHQLVPAITESFGSVLQEDQFDITYRNKKVKTYYIYVLKDLHSSKKL